MSLRLLDTGTARDISGVIRINVGEGVEMEQGDQKMETRELLYFVAGDGNVRVFERGQ
jgi:elongator complex protein 6